MTRLMIIVGSVRPGRVGLPIAQWVRDQVAAHSDFDIDFVDLIELALPFMDEPRHPRFRDYHHDHTKAWSARVEAADAILLVTPEYNHGYSPALKNAMDFLSAEWFRKPVGFVSYGGASGGLRAVESLVLACIGFGLVKLDANVEIAFVSRWVAEGIFTPDEKHVAGLDAMLAEFGPLAAALATVRGSS